MTETKPPSLMSEVHIRPTDRGIGHFRFWMIIAIGAVIILAIGGLYWHSQSQLRKAKQELQQQQNDPAARLRDENKQLVDQVGKLIILPTDEQPTIATVSDLSKLQNQAFFAKAQLGDKVLIYSQAKKAILYRPSTNQIIELAPLLDDSTPAAPATPTAPAQVPAP